MEESNGWRQFFVLAQRGGRQKGMGENTIAGASLSEVNPPLIPQ